MKMGWIIYATLALLMWGLWSFLPRLSANYISPKSGLVYEVIGVAIVGLAILISINFKPEVHTKGILFAILTGIVGTLGILFFWFAVTQGKVSVVVPYTALYPLIGIILAMTILGEKINTQQGIGIFLALVSIFLMTRSS